MKKIISVILLVLLFMGSLALAYKTRNIVPNADGTIYYVGPPPADFSSIQEAINNESVTENDIIEVMYNTGIPYYENVTVNKSVTIRHYSYDDPGEYPIINGGNRAGVVFNITAPEVEIEGFQIRNGFYGIQLNSSSNKISNNTIAYNGHGLFINIGSANNTLRENNLRDNTLNFGIEPIGRWNISTPLAHFIQDIDESNTVNGKPIYYWINQHDRTIPTDAGCVAIINSTSISVEACSLQGNFVSLLVAYSSNITVQNLECLNPLNYAYTPYDDRDRLYGVVLKNVSDSVIQSNNFLDAGTCIFLGHSENNSIKDNNIFFTFEDGFGDTGIALYWSRNNSVLDNIIKNNYVTNEIGMGLVVSRSVGNSIIANSIYKTSSDLVLEFSNGSIFLHNNFYKESNRVVAYSYNNSFDNGYEGNHWPTYEGTDNNGDGIGDAPHRIYPAPNIYDNHPLIEEWNSSKIIDLTKNSPTPQLITIECNHVTASHEYKPDWAQKEGIIAFNITSNTFGFCNITIPRDKLDGPFDLFINGTLIDYENYTFTYDKNYSSIVFSFPKGKHMMKIIGYRAGNLFCDINGDGIVDITDISRVIAEYGEAW